LSDRRGNGSLTGGKTKKVSCVQHVQQGEMASVVETVHEAGEKKGGGGPTMEENESFIRT